MSAKKKPREVHMLVSVPHIDGLTAAQHRAGVRDAVRNMADYYGRHVAVKPAKAPTGTSQDDHHEDVGKKEN